MVGVTPEGAFFVERLRLNRPQLVAYRNGARARKRLLKKLAEAQHYVQALERRMIEIDTAIDAATDDLEGA